MENLNKLGIKINALASRLHVKSQADADPNYDERAQLYEKRFEEITQRHVISILSLGDDEPDELGN